MEHGKRWTYVKHKCRCAPCVAANAAYMESYRSKNKAKILAREVERYGEQKERIIARQSAYYDREKTAVLERQRRAERKRKRVITQQRRKARQLGQFVEDVDPAVVFLRGNFCGVCGDPVYEDYDLDHILPLSRGGLHCYANIQLAHPRCNRRKHNRLPTIEELER